jgi:hypothetical protein
MKPSSKSKAFAECCKISDLATPVQYSKQDYKSTKSNSSMNVEMTPDLAEICGIHAGDGYMRKRGNKYEFEVSGGTDEKEYYDSHVVPLFEKYFKLNITPQYMKSNETYGFRICKKEVVEILHACGFPYGKKTFTVNVPKQVLQSRNLDIIYRFIRGAFDTDGTLSFRRRNGSGYREIHTKRHTLPTIKFSCCSKSLTNGISKLLIQTGFSFSFGQSQPKNNRGRIYYVSLQGDQPMIIWLANIGFKNTTKLNRFFIWQKHGFCPAGLNIENQRQIIAGKINPNSFYKSKVDISKESLDGIASRQIERLKVIGIPIPKD